MKSSGFCWEINSEQCFGIWKTSHFTWSKLRVFPQRSVNWSTHLGCQDVVEVPNQPTPSIHFPENVVELVRALFWCGGLCCCAVTCQPAQCLRQGQTSEPGDGPGSQLPLISGEWLSVGSEGWGMQAGFVHAMHALPVLFSNCCEEPVWEGRFLS